MGVRSVSPQFLSAKADLWRLDQQQKRRAAAEGAAGDVQITPARDAPLRELTAEDFEVAVSGRKRPVTSAARVKTADSAFATQWLVWRLPIR